MSDDTTAETLIVKDWSVFQHYRDRKPPWIKLHRALLDSSDFARLSDLSGKYLPLVWIIASDTDGAVPPAAELGFRLRVAPDQAETILAELCAFGFLVCGSPTEQPEWASRHVSAEIKKAVWARDGGRCKACSSRDRLEFDHVLPISRGGTSVEANLQLLCRSCNRKKRNKMTAAEQSATSTPIARSNVPHAAEPRDRGETEYRVEERQTPDRPASYRTGADGRINPNTPLTENPLVTVGQKQEKLSECFRLIARKAELANQDPTEAAEVATGYTDKRGVYHKGTKNPSHLSYERLCHSVDDLKADIAAMEAKNG